MTDSWSAPTIADVASAAGVSAATVSRALNGSAPVNADTLARVLAAVESLGYRPNAAARSMRAGRSRTIGLVMINTPSSSFFGRVTRAVIHAADLRGYEVIVTQGGEDPAAEAEAVDTLLAKQVDGIIVIPCSGDDHSHLETSHMRGTPVVTLDRRIASPPLSSVTTDDASGCREAVLHAVEHGHRRLGFLVAVGHMSGATREPVDGGASTVRERILGFAAGCREAAVPAEDQTWVYAGGPSGDLPEGASLLLDSTPRPTVIMASNNEAVLALLASLRDRRLTVGRDVSIITVDDNPWIEAGYPSLTVIARPVDQMADEAVSLLATEIEHGKAGAQHICLPTELVRRESVTRWSSSSAPNRREEAWQWSTSTL